MRAPKWGSIAIALLGMLLLANLTHASITCPTGFAWVQYAYVNSSRATIVQSINYLPAHIVWDHAYYVAEGRSYATGNGIIVVNASSDQLDYAWEEGTNNSATSELWVEIPVMQNASYEYELGICMSVSNNTDYSDEAATFGDAYDDRWDFGDMGGLYYGIDLNLTYANSIPEEYCRYGRCFNASTIGVHVEDDKYNVNSGEILYTCDVYRIGTSGYGAIINQRYGGSAGRWSFFRQTSDQGHGFYAGGSELDSNTVIPANQWVRIGARLATGGLYWYYNGSADGGPDSYSYGGISSHNLTIGSQSDLTTELFVGYIDECRIAKGAKPGTVLTDDFIYSESLHTSRMGTNESSTTTPTLFLVLPTGTYVNSTIPYQFQPAAFSEDPAHCWATIGEDSVYLGLLNTTNPSTSGSVSDRVPGIYNFSITCEDTGVNYTSNAHEITVAFYSEISPTYNSTEYETVLTNITGRLNISENVSAVNATLNYNNTAFATECTESGYVYSCRAEIYAPLAALNLTNLTFSFHYTIDLTNGSAYSYEGSEYTQSVRWGYWANFSSAANVLEGSSFTSATTLGRASGVSASVSVNVSFNNGTSIQTGGPPIYSATHSAPQVSSGNNQNYPTNSTVHLTHSNTSTSRIIGPMSGATNIWKMQLLECGGITNTTTLNITTREETTNAAVIATQLRIYNISSGSITRGYAFLNITNNSLVCIYPSFAVVTASGIEVYNATGYGSRTFFTSGITLSSSQTRYTRYLAADSEAYLFHVVDIYDNDIREATIIAYGFNFETLEWDAISEVETDYTGTTTLYLIPYRVYRIAISKEGYADVEFDFTPASVTTIEIIMYESRTTPIPSPAYLDYVWNDVAVEFSPAEGNYNTSQTLRYTVMSNQSLLQYYGVIITYTANGTTTTVYESNITASPTGGSITYTTLLNGTYKMYSYFKHSNYSLYNNMPRVFYINTNATGLAKAMEVLEAERPVSGWGYYLAILVIAMLSAGFIARYSMEGAVVVAITTLWIGSLIFANVEVVNFFGASITPVGITGLLTIIGLGAAAWKGGY